MGHKGCGQEEDLLEVLPNSCTLLGHQALRYHSWQEAAYPVLGAGLEQPSLLGATGSFGHS